MYTHVPEYLTYILSMVYCSSVLMHGFSNDVCKGLVATSRLTIQKNPSVVDNWLSVPYIERCPQFWGTSMGHSKVPLIQRYSSIRGVL